MKIKREQNVYQFKNAVHMGYMNCQEPTNNTQSCMNTQRSGFKFSPDTSRTTLHHSKHIVSNRKTIQHMGITIDDEGNVLLAKWQNNKINGRYFLFKPLGFNQQSRTRQSGICQFGFMNNSILYNQNFLYDVNGSLAKSSFQRDKIYDKCYIYHQSNLKGSKQKIQCKLLTFQSNLKPNTPPQQKNKIFIPPIKNLGKNGSNKQNLPLVELSSSQLSTLSQFLQNFVEQAKQQEVIQYMPFQKIFLSQTEFCIGFFKNQTAQNKKGKDKQSIINNVSGFGIFFRNDWPCKYGFFQQGKLNGSGRLYQSQLQVLDGLFENDQLIQGFIFDYFKNRTSFVQKFDNNQFKIHQEIGSIDTAYMLEYKKSQHLKSLDFTNNYFNVPNIIYKSPWPYQVAKLLEENNSLKYIINEFKNELDISQIERKGQLTEDKVQELLIKELKQPEETSRVLISRSKINQVKNMAIRNGINSYLRQLQPSPQQRQTSRQRELKKSIQQYEQLIIVRKSTSRVKKRSRNKSGQQSKVKKSSKLSKYNKPQLTSREQIHIQDHSNCSQQKSKDFGELISTYRDYEVQKNAILTQEAFFQNLNKIKKHKVQSKLTMIKLDHQKHLNDMNRSPHKPCHHKKNKTALQLDLIYRMHFKQHKK